MVMLDWKEVDTIEREEWRSVETNNGGECVTIGGMKKTQLLSVDMQLGFSEEGAFFNLIA